jgi:hypothetical protein
MLRGELRAVVACVVRTLSPLVVRALDPRAAVDPLHDGAWRGGGALLGYEDRGVEAVLPPLPQPFHEVQLRALGVDLLSLDRGGPRRRALRRLPAQPARRRRGERDAAVREHAVVAHRIRALDGAVVRLHHGAVHGERRGSQRREPEEQGRARGHCISTQKRISLGLLHL